MERRADSGGKAAASLADQLFDAPDAARCLAGADGTIRRVNAEWLRVTGRVEREGLGTALAALFPGAADQVRGLIARALAGEQVEIPPHPPPGGGEGYREATLAPVALEGETVLLVVSREVPSPRPGMSAVVARLRAIADRAPTAVVLKGSDGRFLFANRWFEELLGLRRGEVLGKSAADLFPGPIAERIAAHERRVAAGQELEGEEVIPTPRGERTLFTVRFPIPLEDESVGTVGLAVDVTERRRAEAALRESEERFRLLARAMPQIVCVIAPDGAPEYVNPSWIAFSELDLAATARVGWAGIIHPDDLEAARACRLHVLKTLSPQDVELRYRAADGSYRWFVSRLAPVVQGGRVVRLVGAAMEIEGRKRAEEALRDANAQLRDADRRKDEFLGMLSHELRNPLAPIRHAAYILRRAEGTDQARRTLGVVERQTEHLTRLVDDLLDVTRIARGKIELRREPVELGDLARRAAEDLRAAFEVRGVALHLELPLDPLHAEADPTRVAQVLGNLLANAAKFTRPGDAVTLAVRRAGDAAELAVADTGAGIDPALLPHVFEAFVQGERTLARTQGGLGLGLALVKAIVELHGGAVRAESAGEGKGTTVTVRLPLVPRPAGAAGAPPQRRLGSARRVLVVDDNRDAADTLADLVVMLGHEADVAYDGPAALARARERPPDLVLCDIGLPGMDGFEVARRLRALSPTTRLVAVSGYAQPEDLARAAEAGFERHVAKPPDLGQLEDVLG